MREELVGTVRSLALNRSLALTVPYLLREECGFKKGDRFAVKTDAQGRIIYEKISGGQGTATQRRPCQPAPTRPHFRGERVITSLFWKHKCHPSHPERPAARDS